jgi:dienelactone hydrolase
MALAVAVGFVLILVVMVAHSLSFDAPKEFWMQKGVLDSVDSQPVEGDSLYEAHEVTLISSAGYRVRGYLRVPREEGRWPAVIVIGGTNTGRMAAELFTPDDPYVILGLDYPWEGPRHLNWFQFLVRVFAVRRAMLLTPSAVMLGVDYLESRDDVDIGKLVFAGASFGAPLMVVAGALDQRAETVMSVYGGANFDGLLQGSLKVKPLWLRAGVAKVGAWLVSPLAPEKYVQRIAPRRTIIINGSRDDRIPRYSVELLYDSAGEPKQLIWLDEGHISSRDPELLERVLQAASGALNADEPDNTAEEGAARHENSLPRP